MFGGQEQFPKFLKTLIIWGTWEQCSPKNWGRCQPAKKSQKVIRNRVKHQSHLVVKNELFNPQDPSNFETDEFMADVGTTTSETLLKECGDKKIRINIFQAKMVCILGLTLHKKRNKLD